MGEALQGLLELLDLEEIDQNIYRGRNEQGQRERLFGGQVAAQALAAAGRTVSGRVAHSLHAYFLRPGDPRVPVLYTVDRIRDGQSFTTRCVVAIQRGQAIFNMSISFQVNESGYEHQQIDMPAAPEPEALPTWAERAEQARHLLPKESFGWVRGEHDRWHLTLRIESGRISDEPGRTLLIRHIRQLLQNPRAEIPHCLHPDNSGNVPAGGDGAGSRFGWRRAGGVFSES